MSCRVVQNLQVHLVELGHYLGQRKARRLGGPCRTKPRTQPVILEQAPYRAGQFCGVARLHVHAFDTVGYHIQQTPECRDHTRGPCRQAFHSNTPEPLGHHARHNADDGVSPRGDHRLSRDVGRDDDPGTVINPEILAGQTREDQRRIYPLCAEAGVCIEENVDTFVGPQGSRIEQVGPSGGDEIRALSGPLVAGQREQIIVDERRDHRDGAAVGGTGRRTTSSERIGSGGPLGNVAVPPRSQLVQTGG